MPYLETTGLSYNTRHKNIFQIYVSSFQRSLVKTIYHVTRKKISAKKNTSLQNWIKKRWKTPFFFMLHTLLLQCTVDIYLEGTSNVGKSIYSFHLPTKKPIWLAKIEYKGSQKFDWNVPFAETLWQSYPRQRICHHPTGSKRSKNQAQKKFPKNLYERILDSLLIK